ncbi:hypothetical protein L7F22_036537 [Adiantum nelumboides]|nr:hypothetical protein [Adiantum nelumboides]
MSERDRRLSQIYYTRAQARAGNIDPFHYDDVPENERIDLTLEEQVVNFGGEISGTAEGGHIDFASGFNNLVQAASRVEKRLDMTKSSKRGTKDSESVSKLGTSSSVELDTESSSDEEEKKKKKSLAKKKKNKTSDEVDLIQQVKSIRYLIIAPKDKRFYEICEKNGHTTAQCWYNPKQRNKPPSGIGRGNTLAEANQVAPF